MSREAGFSLVELLAVLAIMSLMIGAVVASRPSQPSATDRQTARMGEQLTRFLDDAALAGEIRALGASRDGIALYAHDGLRWTELTELPWPGDARIELREDGRRVKLLDEPQPLYRFEPYGAVPDISLHMRGPDAVYTLAPDVRGRFQREVER